jgi:hypothetical protein
MEESAMPTKKHPKISFRIWPPRIDASGNEAIAVVKGPLQLLLYVAAISKIVTTAVLAAFAIVVFHSCLSGGNACGVGLATHLLH